MQNSQGADRSRCNRGHNGDGRLHSLTCMECCERNDLIEPVGCKDGTLPPKLMAEFLHPPGVDQPPRTLAVVHPIPLPQSSTSIFRVGGQKPRFTLPTSSACRRSHQFDARCPVLVSGYLRRNTAKKLNYIFLARCSNSLEYDFRAGRC